jgi:hypothetical protein
MKRLRYYQLSLRGLLILTAFMAAGLWLALTWVGRITPQRGETLVTSREQRILQAMKEQCRLNFVDSPPLLDAT